MVNIQNRQNYLLMVLCSLILTACGTDNEESIVQKSSSLEGNNDACVEKLWPRKENFRPLTTANSLFECIGKQLQQKLDEQGIDITAHWSIPDNFFNGIAQTQRSPFSLELFSIGIVEPCYYQQKYNQIPTSESKVYFIFDKMVDCIINAIYEHWQYRDIMAQKLTATKTGVSLIRLPADIADTCILDYRHQTSKTQNALPRLRSLQECLFKAIHTYRLINKENVTPEVSQNDDNAQLIKEEQEAIELEILTDEEDITVDAKTVKMIEACIEEYQQNTEEDVHHRTEKLIDCSINSIYKRMASWNVNIKANIVSFSSQNQFLNDHDMKFDLIIPLWKNEEERQMIAIQPGFLLSIYSHKDPLLQGSVGLLYRLAIKNGIVGLNIFNDVHIVGDKSSYRFSIGGDYQDEWNRFSVNFYPPLSEWIDLNEYREKRQILGFDLKFTRSLSEKFYVSTAIAFWGSINEDYMTIFLDGVLGYNINCQTAFEAGLSYDMAKKNFTGHLGMFIKLDDPSFHDLLLQDCHRKNFFSIGRKADRVNNPLR